MIKFQISTLLMVCITLFGCGDSDPIDTTITPEYIEPVEAYIIGQNSITSIEVPNPNLPTPRTEVSTTLILDDINNITIIDTDLSDDRDNEAFPSDRGVPAEFFTYLKSKEPEKLFLYNAKSRRNQTVYDLTDAINKNGDRLFCELRPSDLADIARLQQNQFEVKQELKVVASTATNNCGDSEDVNYYLFTINPDGDSQYSVRQPVELENDDPAIIEYEIQKISYPLYRAHRSSVDRSFFKSRNLIISSKTGSYGFLNYDLKADSSLTKTALWSLHMPIDSDNPETYQYWQVSFSNQSTDTETAKVLNPFMEANDSYLINLGNQLLKISKRETFELLLETGRRQNLSNPIYNWSASYGAENGNFSIFSDNSVALIDGNKLKLIDSQGTSSEIRELNNIDNRLIPSLALTVLQETNENSESLSIIERTGTKRLIIGQAKAIQAYPFQDYFDYYMLDANAFVDHRYAQIHNNGTIKFNPPIENSAWLSLKNYLEDDLQQLILHSEDTSSGLMRSPKIYAFDTLEVNGQGTYKGMIDADFAVIEEAAIIGERFGMIWVRESFEDNASLKAYYFNPSDSEWAFTLISEEAIMPNWLPYMKP